MKWKIVVLLFLSSEYLHICTSQSEIILCFKYSRSPMLKSLFAELRHGVFYDISGVLPTRLCRLSR